MGYRAASTRAIARQAKINQVTLFRLFKGKAQLYAAVVKHLLATSNLRGELESRLAEPLEGSDLIRVAIEAISDVMFQNPAFYKIILYSVLESDSRSIRKIWRDLEPIYALLARHIDEGIQDHRLRRVDSLAAARLIVATALQHYEVYELYRGKKLPGFRTKDLSSHYADIIYYGLKAD
jgi:AcrR family transcriptional regulator